MDAASGGRTISKHPVIGDLEIVRPTMRVNAAAGLTIGEAHAVDAGRCAIEIARSVRGRIGCASAGSLVLAHNRYTCAFFNGQEVRFEQDAGNEHFSRQYVDRRIKAGRRSAALSYISEVAVHV